MIESEKIGNYRNLSFEEMTEGKILKKEKISGIVEYISKVMDEYLHQKELHMKTHDFNRKNFSKRVLTQFVTFNNIYLL